MSFVESILDKMKLNGNDEDDEYDDYEDDDDDDVVSNVRSRKKQDSYTKKAEYAPKEREKAPKRVAPQPEPKPAAPRQAASRPQSRPARPQSSGRVVSMQDKYNPMEVCSIKPTNVEEGREIADTLLSGRAVIINLEGLDMMLAQRIIDFTVGVCVAIEGKLKKVSNYIFIATPSQISISGDFLEAIASSDVGFGVDSEF